MTTAEHLRLLARQLDSQPGHAVTVPRESLVVALREAHFAPPMLDCGHRSNAYTRPGGENATTRCMDCSSYALPRLA